MSWRANFVVAGGEMGLIARRGDVIAFIEVKARPSFDEALMAIGPIKKRRNRPRRAHLVDLQSSRNAREPTKATPC